MKFQNHPFLTAVLGLSVSFSVSASGTIIFTNFHAFGDSLTDSGNVFMATGGTQPNNPNGSPGRWGNGPTWAEKLATEHIGLPSFTNSLAGGNNHAWGGAWTDGGGSVPTIIDQINGFVGSGGSFEPTGLVTIWSGANDFFFGTTDPSIPVANLSNALSLVSAAGAENVLILNLPDLGKTPGIQALGPETAAGMSALVGGFNSLLAAEVAAQRANLGINIVELDIYALNEQILASPGDYGFTNVTDTVVGTGDFLNSSNYPFWDDVHPTDPVHDLFAAEAASAMGIPEPSSSLLLLSAAFLAIGRRRR